MPNSTAHLIDIERRQNNHNLRQSSSLLNPNKIPEEKSNSQRSNYGTKVQKNLHSGSMGSVQYDNKYQKRISCRKWTWVNKNRKSYQTSPDKLRRQPVRLEKGYNSSSMPDMNYKAEKEINLLKFNFKIKVIDPGSDSKIKLKDKFVSHSQNVNFSKPVAQLVKISKADVSDVQDRNKRNMKGNVWGRVYTPDEMFIKRREIHQRLNKPREATSKACQEQIDLYDQKQFEELKFYVDDSVKMSGYSQQYSSKGGSRYKYGTHSRFNMTQHDREINQNFYKSSNRSIFGD